MSPVTRRRNIINRWVEEGRYVQIRAAIVGSMTFDRPVRVTEARIRKGALEARRLDTGRWLSVAEDDLIACA